MNNYQKLEEIRVRLPDGDDYGRRLCDELMADEEERQRRLLVGPHIVLHGTPGGCWDLELKLWIPSRAPQGFDDSLPVQVLVFADAPEGAEERLVGT